MRCDIENTRSTAKDLPDTPDGGSIVAEQAFGLARDAAKFVHAGPGEHSVKTV
jgi:hypothetical protein